MLQPWPCRVRHQVGVACLPLLFLQTRILGSRCPKFSSLSSHPFSPLLLPFFCFLPPLSPSFFFFPPLPPVPRPLHPPGSSCSLRANTVFPAPACAPLPARSCGEVTNVLVTGGGWGEGRGPASSPSAPGGDKNGGKKSQKGALCAHRALAQLFVNTFVDELKATPPPSSLSPSAQAAVGAWRAGLGAESTRTPPLWVPFSPSFPSGQASPPPLAALFPVVFCSGEPRRGCGGGTGACPSSPTPPRHQQGAGSEGCGLHPLPPLHLSVCPAAALLATPTRRIGEGAVGAWPAGGEHSWRGAGALRWKGRRGARSSQPRFKVLFGGAGLPSTGLHRCRGGGGGGKVEICSGELGSELPTRLLQVRV